MHRQRTVAIACWPGLITGLLLVSTLLRAQTPKLDPNNAQHALVPTVTFTFNWPSIEPHRYVISVDSNGDAAYQSWTTEAGADQPVGEPYALKFTASAGARGRIFDLARQLKYFQGDFEYRKHRVADTGEKTLAYADPDKRYETRYNWSENPAIDQLTALFQGMSTTIESGRRLTRLLRFDRLGLDQELKNVERVAVDGRATELQIIAPVIEQLAADPGVMNIARQRARHILQLSAGAASAGSAAPR